MGKQAHRVYYNDYCININRFYAKCHQNSHLLRCRNAFCSHSHTNIRISPTVYRLIIMHKKLTINHLMVNRFQDCATQNFHKIHKISSWIQRSPLKKIIPMDFRHKYIIDKSLDHHTPHSTTTAKCTL